MKAIDNADRDETAAMRRSAIDSQYREVRRWSVVTFQGGPLDGLRIRVLPSEASSYRVGFCIVTSTGPVQALYAPGPAGHQWGLATHIEDIAPEECARRAAAWKPG